MRKSFLTILGTASVLLLAGFGCDSGTVKKFMPPEPPMEPTISSPDSGLRGGNAPMVTFGQELVMSLHTKVSFKDGLTMEVVSVESTVCPEGTKCDKPDSSTVKVQLAGGTVGAMPKEVTVSRPSQVVAKQDGYVLFLGSATGNTATLTLSKEQPPKPKPTAKPLPPVPPKDPPK